MKQWTALHVVRTIHLFSRCVLFVDKNADWDQNCSLHLIYFQRSRVFLHWFSHMCLTLLLAYMRNRRIFMAKCVNELVPRALWFVMASIIKVRLKFLTFFFLPFKYPWLRSHDFMYIFKSGKSVCVTVCRSGYQCLIIWAILARRILDTFTWQTVTPADRVTLPGTPGNPPGRVTPAIMWTWSR